MLLNYAINKSRALSLIIISLFILLVLSVIANALLSTLVYYQRNETQTRIIPMVNSDNAQYTLSNKGYDSRYLRDMGMSFINLRLNVTPETVASNHKLLLSFVAKESRPKMVDTLTKEANLIVNDDLTSAFYFEGINVYPAADIFEVTGVLKTWSGKYALDPQPKKYQLKVNYANGTFEIEKFIEVNNEN